MELLRDGALVRVRSRVAGAYLHADEVGEGVSLSPSRASLRVAWEVRVAGRGGRVFVLLHGVARGRYLALGTDPDTGRRVVVQREHAAPGHPPSIWNAVSIWAEGERRYVVLRHLFHGLALRAEGCAAAAVSAVEYPSPVLHWT
ncbi:unnamed protein product [Urochloa humidicola]